jgi:hypothetical protein
LDMADGGTITSYGLRYKAGSWQRHGAFIGEDSLSAYPVALNNQGRQEMRLAGSDGVGSLRHG